MYDIITQWLIVDFDYDFNLLGARVELVSVCEENGVVESA